MSAASTTSLRTDMMPTLLLSTKLYVSPPREYYVPPPHLLEWLAKGLARALTLVYAPASFGKTTLLSEWGRRSWQSHTSSICFPIRFLCVWWPENLDDGCGRLELMPEPPQSLLFAPETWVKVIAVEK
jgi:hypothetical protein